MKQNRFFSKAIFLHDLKRGFFVPIAFLILLLIQGPFQLYLSYKQQFAIVPLGQYVPTVNEYLNLIRTNTAILCMPVVIMLAAVIAGMVVFSYLFSTKATYMLHAMPVTRTSMFVSHVISGMLMLMVPILVTGAILCLLAFSIAGTVAIPYVLLPVAAGICTTIFFFGLVSFTAMLTGSLIALPVLSILLNLMFEIFYALIISINAPFFFGFVPWNFTADTPLSPVYYLSNHMFDYEADFLDDMCYPIFHGYWGYVVLIAIVGVALMIFANLLYQRRPLECVKQVLAQRALRPVLRWSVAFCVSAAAIMVFSEVIKGQANRSGHLLFEILCFVIVGLVAFLVVEMLIKRTLRIFHKRIWKEYALMAACFVVFCICLYFDPLGNETRIPSFEKVESVNVQMEVSNVLTIQNEEVADVMAVHRLITDHRGILQEQQRQIDTWYYTGAQNNFIYLDLTYQLTNGQTLKRYYGFIYDEAYPESVEIVEDMAEIMNRPHRVAENIILDETDDTLLLHSISVYPYTPDMFDPMPIPYNTEGEDVLLDEDIILEEDMMMEEEEILQIEQEDLRIYGTTVETAIDPLFVEDENQQKELMEAIIQDIEEGNIRLVLAKNKLANVSLDYIERGKDEFSGKMSSFELNDRCVHVLSVLDRFGYQLP